MKQPTKGGSWVRDPDTKKLTKSAQPAKSTGKAKPTKVATADEQKGADK